MNKEIKKYIRCVKALIPTNSKESKDFILSLNKKITRSFDNGEIHNHNELLSIFGSPNEIVVSYLNELEPTQIIKQLRKKRTLSNIMFTGILIVILSGIIGIYNIHKKYEETALHLLNIRVETTITENPIPQEGE